jgi:putative flippase GtrA
VPVGRFHRFCVQVVARLPFGLKEIVAPTLLGFCLINSFTFGVDVVLLTALHGWLNTPLPVAVTVAYACAFALSYVLNRIFNFQSHAPVGPQFAVYASNLLAALGLDYRVSRLVAVPVRRCTCTA